MKPWQNDRAQRNGLKGVRMSGQTMMNMLAASSFMSLVTLMLVLYSYYAIPARIEQERAGRLEELQAISDLVNEVDELTETVVRLTNAGNNSARNPR